MRTRRNHTAHHDLLTVCKDGVEVDVDDDELDPTDYGSLHDQDQAILMLAKARHLKRLDPDAVVTVLL